MNPASLAIVFHARAFEDLEKKLLRLDGYLYDLTIESPDDHLREASEKLVEALASMASVLAARKLLREVQP
jgi:hypothetical protein